MGYGEVWWFAQGGQQSDLDGAIEALKGAGLKVGNPASGEPQIIDGNGQQRFWDATEVSRSWIEGRSVTLQFWLDRETDVLCRIIGDRGLTIFDLDGMTAAEARRVVFAVLNAASSISGTLAVISDTDFPEWGDELTAAEVHRLVKAVPDGMPDLIFIPSAGNVFSLIVKPGSWLSAPSVLI